MIEVRNRKLEQFYFMHGVDFLECWKDQTDGMTVWGYEDNAENRHILHEFQVALQRRATKKEPEYRKVL